MEFSYSDLFEDQCPPAIAQESEGLVFRGVRRPPLSDGDFLSHFELGLPNANDNDCNHRGLSVWRTQAAVLHAKKVIPAIRKWKIAAGILEPTDGLIAPTPAERQPEHFTFWKLEHVQVTGKFTITELIDGGV
jgi:hypothetical protein